MRQLRKVYRLGIEWLSLLTILLAAPLSVSAAGTPPPLAVPAGLSIAELKITSDEFVVLQNNTAAAIPDLSVYWLYDFNNVSPLASGVSSSQQQLPAVALDAGQTLLLSATTRNTCGAEIAGKLSVSLTDGGGFLQVVRLTQDTSGAVQQTSGDVVSWSNGASGNIQNVPASSKDPQGLNLYYRYQNGSSYAWQLAATGTTNACQLTVTSGGTMAPAVTAGLATTSVTPPATIISLEASSDSGSDSPTLPVGDVGLSAPIINELLPNPAGTGNDGTDEYIELYNPNAASFDLSGFVLQTGATTKHNYTFPADTMLAPQSFTAFYSADTKLSLSNTAGQAALVDPFGNVLNQTDPYGTAKDGVAWALANGKWYFTSVPTPNAANVIKQAALASSKSTSSKSTSKSSSKTTAAAGGSSSGSSDPGASQVAQVTPVHPWTLAVVAALAVAYGLYEYRLDVANRFYQFRKHRAARRGARFAVAGR